jgi:penicillin-binding protein 2
MTISQGGTGSGASGEAVRRIYEAMYGITKDSAEIDPKKGIMPKPLTTLPKISDDGAVTQASYTVPATEELYAPADGPRTADGAGPAVAAVGPGRPEKLLLGRRYWS